MDEVLIHRIDLLVKHCDEVINDTNGKSYEDFSSSDLLIRATCFSIVQIGEQLRVLEKKIGKLFPNLPWSEGVSMRNFVVHDYSRVDIGQVYKVATEEVPSLKESFVLVKNELITKAC